MIKNFNTNNFTLVLSGGSALGIAHLGVLEMFEKSMRLLIVNQSKTHVQNVDKNITLIEPSTKDYNTFSFHKHKEIRALGLGLLT